ncbi:MAG: nucleotidyl transferase AbiEii/AbiGii toxin family protein [bacterium]|nr:nucleotidyl transferase AbiEii/AbiGii toxin family protein [bacterium]
MLDISQLQQLAIREQTQEINITREYCQHLFLSYFYKINEHTDQILFKGGTALRIAFQSPRFSEDLDFSAKKTYMVSDLLTILSKKLEDENINIEIQDNNETATGYIAFIKFNLPSILDSPIIKINIRQTHRELESSSKLIINKFIPSYHLLCLNEREMVREKIQAFHQRVKARDFFDLYFMLTSNELRGYVTMHGKEYQDDIINQLDRLSDQELKNELTNFLPISFKNLYTGDGFRSTLRKQIEKYILFK